MFKKNVYLYMVLRKPTGTRSRGFCLFSAETFEVRALVRPNVIRIVGVNTKSRVVASLEQLQQPNIVNRAPISSEEVINLKDQISEAEIFIDNGEKLR